MPLLKGGQYPGLFLFSTPARMMRPVLNLATKTKELIGSFEQVEYIVGHNIEFGWGREGGGGGGVSAPKKFIRFAHTFLILKERYCLRCSDLTVLTLTNHIMDSFSPPR